MGDEDYGTRSYLDKLVGMKTRFEHATQGESGGNQSSPTAGAARRDFLQHRGHSPMVKAWFMQGE